jgi:hypothetical protein
MTAVLAAVEIFWEPTQETETAPAFDVVERLPIAAERVAAAQPGTPAKVFRFIWSGLKLLARAAGRLISVGLLAGTVFYFGRALWEALDQQDAGEGGRVLRFPGPRLEETS